MVSLDDDRHCASGRHSRRQAIRTDIAERVVAAGVQYDELVRRWLGRRQNPLDRDDIGHAACTAIDAGIDRAEDVDLPGGHAVPGKEDEGKVCSRRTLFEVLQGIEERTAVEIEAAGRLAVTRDHLEAVLDEKVRVRSSRSLLLISYRRRQRRIRAVRLRRPDGGMGVSRRGIAKGIVGDDPPSGALFVCRKRC
jgi:hypothetical protein